MTCTVKPIKPFVLSLWLFAVFAPGFVQAQTTQFVTYEDPQGAFSLEYPADWQLEPRTDGDGVLITADADTGFYVYAEPLGTEALAIFSRLTPRALSDLTLEELQEEDPSFQVIETMDVTVDGFPATARRFSVTNSRTQVPVTGLLVTFFSDSHFFILLLGSDAASYPQVEPVLEQIYASFTLTPAHNPLDPPLSAPFVGTFKSEPLTLTLEGDGETYRGQLLFGQETFPVTAQATEDTLTGTFESGGKTFGFTATLTEDTMTFMTEGTSYVLQKETPDANPLG